MSADQVVAQDLAAAVFRDTSMTETSGVALSTTAKASHATRKTSKSGVRREVAELMVDQQRRAANVEELAFFKQEAARLTQDNTSGTSVAERDDRGGRIGSPTSPDGVSSSQGGSAAILPAQHRWIMIPPEVATVVGRGDDDCVRQEVRGAWSWKRTDDAVEDAVLTYSAQMLEETESVTFSSLELSAALCYDGVWNGPTKRRGLKPTGDDDVRTFFSFTQEEYQSLPSTPSPQLSSINDDDDEFVFDFASSHKLAVLYERFGNFEVVCDRWRWSDASGCQSSVTTPKMDWRKEGFPTSAEDGMAAPLAPPTTPSVGALCEEYQRLTEGILQLRLQRLTTIVEGGSTVEGCDGPHAAITSPNNAAPSSSVGRHPVVSMAAHHTFLGDGQSGEVTQETTEGADTDATPSSPVAPTLKRPREEVGEVAGRTSSNDVFAVLSTPIPWFSRQRLQQRQTLLRRLLAEESETNVPYQEAARKYTSLVDQAANIIQHLRGIGFEEEGQPPVELPALSPLPDVVVLRERGKKAERPVSESPTPANPRKIRGSVFSSEAMEDVRMEVEHLIPFNCARIQAAALAGWILAAPTLLPSDPAASNTDVSPDASGRGTDGAEGGGGAPSSASPSKSKTALPLTACNRVYSHLGEAVLVSLPHTVPKIHREVEEVLEQQLLDDHRAMMENSASVFQHTADIRLLYTQNLELQRYVTRLESLSEGLRKVITDTDEAAKGMRV